MRRTRVFILILSCIFFFSVKSIFYPDRESSLERQYFGSKSHRIEETESEWEPIGPEGGNINGLVINSQNKNEIYALASGYPSQLYKSFNSGQTWERLATINSSCYGLAIDSLNPNVIYIQRRYDIFKSSDDGLSWIEYDFADYFYSSWEGIAIAPNKSNIIYVIGRYAYNTSPLKYCMAVCKSTDGGETWDVKKINPTSSSAYTESIAISPLDPNIIYVGGRYRDEGNTWYDKLYKISDGGESWEDITGSIEGEPRAILVNPINPSKVYVGTYRGVYRSSDGGNTWQKNKGYAYAYAFAIDPINSSIIYAGYNERLYKSLDGGVNWTQYDMDYFGSCNCLLVCSASPTHILMGSSIGLYKSVDGGIKWKGSHSGIKALEIDAIAVAPSSSNIIYTSSGYSLYRSNDFGKSWIRLQTMEWLNSLVVNPNNTNELLGVRWGQLFRSTDGGISWNEIFRAYDLDDVAINKNNINRIFLAGSTESESINPIALFKSTDGGVNWTTHGITSTDGYTYAVAVDADNDYNIYISGRFVDNQEWRYALFKSSDGGENWINIGEEIDDIIYDIAIDPMSPNKIFVGTRRGVYKSEDYGMTWLQPKLNFRAEHIKISPNYPTDIFAGGNYGVYFSNNGGNNWEILNDGLIDDNIDCLDIDSHSKYLYAGTFAGSVLRNNLSNLKTLTISSSSGGTTDPAPGRIHYITGTAASIKAILDSWYGFRGWSGDASGTDNPITLSMDSDKNITASFIRIYPPLNFTGEKVLNRSLLGIEYINVLSWQANPSNEGIVGYRIFQVDGNSLSLLEELDADKFEYLHRKVEKDKKYIYAIVSVYSDGSEGEPAYVTVN